jgi:hypothetical protein
MFKAEQEEYKKENVPWTEINYRDNSREFFFLKHEFCFSQENIFSRIFSKLRIVCIDLIEKSGRGILSMLDEECKVPKGADEGFLQRCEKAHARNPYFGKSRVFYVLPFFRRVPAAVFNFVFSKFHGFNFSTFLSFKLKLAIF